jgi:hypothetical protein
MHERSMQHHVLWLSGCALSTCYMIHYCWLKIIKSRYCFAFMAVRLCTVHLLYDPLLLVKNNKILELKNPVLVMWLCQSQVGFFIPIPWTEPASSGTGMPIRFDREPEETAGIQISIQNHSSTGLDRYTDQYTGPVRPGTGLWKKIELVKNLTCFQI